MGGLGPSFGTILRICRYVLAPHWAQPHLGSAPSWPEEGPPRPPPHQAAAVPFSLEMRRRSSSPLCRCGEEAVSVLLEQRVHPPPGSRPTRAPPEPPTKSRMWEAGLGQHTPSKQRLGGPNYKERGGPQPTNCQSINSSQHVFCFQRTSLILFISIISGNK